MDPLACHLGSGQLEVVHMHCHNQDELLPASYVPMPEEIIVVKDRLDSTCLLDEKRDERELEHERGISEAVHGLLTAKNLLAYLVIWSAQRFRATWDRPEVPPDVGGRQYEHLAMMPALIAKAACLFG